MQLILVFHKIVEGCFNYVNPTDKLNTIIDYTVKYSDTETHFANKILEFLWLLNARI